MELLFVFLAGALIGLVSRYALPGRDRHGALLLPALGAATASAVWAALTWAGWRFDGGWIWFWSLVASAIVVIATALLLPRRRREADARLLARLTSPSSAVR